MVLIEALLEIVTAVGAPLLVNVAVLSGKVGLELQLVPVVHSAPGPVQVPSTACAGSGASRASAPSQALPSSAARRRGRPAAGAAAPLARERDGCARIRPVPARAGNGETALAPVPLPPPRD